MTGQGEDRLGRFISTIEGLMPQHQWANKETALKILLEDWFFGMAIEPQQYTTTPSEIMTLNDNLLISHGMKIVLQERK